MIPTGTTNRATAQQDLEDLRRLTHEYCKAVDTSALDDLMTLWADDAVWDVTEFGMGAITGSEAIRAFYAGLIENTTHRCHLALNHLIDLDDADPDHARALVYVHAWVVNPDGSRDESLGYYSDDYVRTGDGWKFARRVVRPLLPPPPPPV